MTTPARPRLVAQDTRYLVLYKPPRMHTVPLRPNEEGTLLAWCARDFPDVLAPQGRKNIEGGVLHRLDFETEGLVLVARTQSFLEALLRQQEEGLFIKEYRASCRDCRSGALPAGFPPRPESAGLVPPFVESAFRPWGPGRKAVRPVTAPSGERAYRTDFLSASFSDDGDVELRVRLACGFRHQVRCHAAWLGFPLKGDALYGNALEGELGLLAQAIEFADPDTGQPVRYEAENP